MRELFSPPLSPLLFFFVGTDIAIEAADVVLMKDDLFSVITAIDLSRKTFNRIKGNLVWALVYNVLALLLASGMSSPLSLSILPVPPCYPFLPLNQGNLACSSACFWYLSSFMFSLRSFSSHLSLAIPYQVEPRCGLTLSHSFSLPFPTSRLLFLIFLFRSSSLSSLRGAPSHHRRSFRARLLRPCPPRLLLPQLLRCPQIHQHRQVINIQIVLCEGKERIKRGKRSSSKVVLIDI